MALQRRQSCLRSPDLIPAGAGVAADRKTFSAQNCYGIAAITALTVQSTLGVKSVHDTPASELRAQLDALLEDIKIAAIKIGMLGHRGNAVVVGEFLDRAGTLARSFSTL